MGLLALTYLVIGKTGEHVGAEGGGDGGGSGHMVVEAGVSGAQDEVNVIFRHLFYGFAEEEENALTETSVENVGELEVRSDGTKLVT